MMKHLVGARASTLLLGRARRLDVRQKARRGRGRVFCHDDWTPLRV